MLDLVVRGGTLATAGGVSPADVGVEDGRIVQLGGDMRGREEVDASGLYVLPGGVDVHVHFTDSGISTAADRRPDDFYTGSLAALAGGITTVGNMTFPWPGDTLSSALRRDQEAASRDSAVDFILHPVVRDPAAAIAEIPALAATGHQSIKIFTVLEEFDAQIDAYVEIMRTAARSGVIAMLHCEDGPITRWLGQELINRGCGHPQYYPQSRPDYTESVSVERAVALARATGVEIYIVHLSSAVALDACRRARAGGQSVAVETRPLYLYLTRERFEEPDAARYVGNPPLREARDVAAMWGGLADADIQCVCSDHAPWTLTQKLDPRRNVRTVLPGVADLETLMPMLFSEGVLGGRLSLERFVEVTSTSAARLFGLYPQKGTIALGSDADLVVWDPTTVRTIDGSQMRSMAGYSPYDGWQVRGWPRFTISRGEIVLDGTNLRAERGRGQWLRASRPSADPSTLGPSVPDDPSVSP